MLPARSPVHPRRPCLPPYSRHRSAPPSGPTTTASSLSETQSLLTAAAAAAAAGGAGTTVVLSSPIPSISTRTTSPGLRNLGGVNPALQTIGSWNRIISMNHHTTTLAPSMRRKRRARTSAPRRPASRERGSGAGRARAPDAGGRPRGDDVPRLQRHALGHNLDQRRDVPDHQVRRAVLPQLPVDPRPDPQRPGAHVQLRRRDDPRAHGAEAVDGLCEEELLVALLQVARRDVVDDGVPEDVLERPAAVRERQGTRSHEPSPFSGEKPHGRLWLCLRGRRGPLFFREVHSSALPRAETVKTTAPTSPWG